jgi:hypothetical protein
MLGMMKTMMQNVLNELLKSAPEDESVREQANVLAAHIMTIPAIKEQLDGLIDTKTFAKILYNLKQKDFDELYFAFERAKEYRRVL